MELTEISMQGLRAGLGSSVFGITICTVCKLAFLDGIEGGINNLLCDLCHDLTTEENK